MVIDFVVNGIPIILCFISVMWNFCLKGYLKAYFVQLIGLEQGIIS